MKELFLYLRQRLLSIDSIAWVDLDKGQLNNYQDRPAIDFPAVLIKIEYPRTNKLQRKQQQCDVMITLSIVYDFMDDTDSITPDETLMQSLKVYDIAEQVHQELQGNSNNDISRSPLDRMFVRDPYRPDKLKVLQYGYATKVIA